MRSRMGRRRSFDPLPCCMRLRRPAHPPNNSWSAAAPCNCPETGSHFAWKGLIGRNESTDSATISRIICRRTGISEFLTAIPLVFRGDSLLRSPTARPIPTCKHLSGASASSMGARAPGLTKHLPRPDNSGEGVLANSGTSRGAAAKW